MPLVKKRITLADGATSDQVLAGTPYEYVSGQTQLTVAACDASAQYVGGVTMDFLINNTSFSDKAEVSQKVTGEAFGWRGGYVLNDTITDGQSVRNRPVVTFSNNSGAEAVIEVAIYIGA